MIDRNTSIRLSVIVPVGTRHEDLRELYHEYCRGLDPLRIPYEFVFVVDGPPNLRPILWNALTY